MNLVPWENSKWGGVDVKVLPLLSHSTLKNIKVSNFLTSPVQKVEWLFLGGGDAPTFIYKQEVH